MKKTSSFLMTVCQVGAEPALKEEIAREHPELRFSYSRPGFVTFKSSQELSPEFRLNSVFARSASLSIGKVEARKFPSDTDRAAEVRRLAAELGSPRLQVFERDRHVPGEEPLGFTSGALAAKVRALLGVRQDAQDGKSALPAPGEAVLSVVVIEEDEWWLGYHVHGPGHVPYPGGVPPITLPPEAPSRAFLKFEEAALTFGIPLRRGDTAVEIGSAPGGASYALLQRGIQVVGIDPAEMDPRVLRMPGFTHIRRPVASVLREELPQKIHWLLLDMNVAPRITLFQVDRLATRLSDTLCGIVLTLKLNEWSMAREIPQWIEHVQAMGMKRVRARQLAHNRQEICLYGLTRNGSRR